MGKVFLNVSGDGSAYCVPIAGTELSDGERFEIYSVPFSGADLEDIRAFDSHDYAVALPPVVNNEITMNFRSGWGNLYVDIYFSGSTPPGPSTIDWLIPVLKRIKDRRRKVD
jgi:hypothetical protein